MPAKSKQQFKFMKAVEGGYIHPKGLSKEKAHEFTKGVHPSKLPNESPAMKLPEHVDDKKKKFHRIKKFMNDGGKKYGV